MRIFSKGERDMEKKKKREAAALRYSPENNGAPEIVALGKGEVAEKIIETARENNVPLYEDAELAHTLSYMEIGSEIPRELYEIVAKILVFVGDIDSKFKE
jgi:flagellar biosynthesis protein